MPRTPSKYACLLADPDTRRWYDAHAQNSLSTAQGYLERLGLFLERTGHTLASFLALPDKQRDDLMSDYITSQYRAGLSISAMRLAKAAAASWLDWHGQKFTRRFKFPRALENTLTSGYRIPDQASLARILDAGDTRARLATALAAQAGLRPGILGNKAGTAGLQFKYLPEARLTTQGIEFERSPTMIRVPAYLAKVRNGFLTFLGPEGCAYLAADVQRRIRDGEQLTPDSAVLAPGRGERPFMARWSVSTLIRDAMRTAGVQEPPYILRSYFANRCMQTNSRDLHPDWREFFMGHTNSISFTYATNKGHLPPDFVDALRRGYEAALEHLETRQSQRQDPWLTITRLLLGAAGVPEDTIAGLDLAGMDREAVVALARQSLQDQIQASAANIIQAQRIIPPTELEAALGRGWRIAFALQDGRFVMEAA